MHSSTLSIDFLELFAVVVAVWIWSPQFANKHVVVHSDNQPTCRAMMTKGMVFRYMWVYSKEDTMAHTCRPVVTS